MQTTIMVPLCATFAQTAHLKINATSSTPNNKKSTSLTQSVTHQKMTHLVRDTVLPFQQEESKKMSSTAHSFVRIIDQMRSEKNGGGFIYRCIEQQRNVKAALSLLFNLYHVVYRVDQEHWLELMQSNISRICITCDESDNDVVRYLKNKILCLLLKFFDQYHISDQIGEALLNYLFQQHDLRPNVGIDRNGNTALLQAVQYGYSRIFYLLIGKGAKITIVNHALESVWTLAAKTENFRMADEIICLIDSLKQHRRNDIAEVLRRLVNELDMQDRTPLMHVLERAALDMAGLMICEANAVLSTLTSLGQNLLMLLAPIPQDKQTQNQQCVDLLFQLSSRKSLRASGLVDPDTVASLSSMFFKTKFPIVQGMVNAVDQCGRTALMYAMQHRNYALLIQLLAHLVDVNASDKEGQTALMYGIQAKFVKGVQKLFAYSNLNLKALNGDDAKKRAMKCHHASPDKDSAAIVALFSKPQS